MPAHPPRLLRPLPRPIRAVASTDPCRRSRLAALLAILLLLPGCAATPRDGAAGPRSAVEPRSVAGRSIPATTLGTGPQTILLIATIHGDEPAGTPLLERLAAEVAADPTRAAGRRLVIVPIANPDGLAAGTRSNARGVDLNRDYPATNARAPDDRAEPETRRLMQLIEQHRPFRIVSIHQPLACIDWDGPAESIARQAAEACDLPLRKLGARPGSLGAWAGEDLGIEVVTIELPRGAERLDEATLWARYGAMLGVLVRE